MTAPTTKPRLTPHQGRVLARLTQLSHRSRLRRITVEGVATLVHDPTLPLAWVDVKFIGCRGTLDRLVAKGYAEVEIRRGPRGGEHRFYRYVEVS